MDDTQTGRRRRLIEFKNSLKVNNITFAKRLKTNPGFVSQLLNGHRSITESFAYQVGKCYSNFNPNWLITGEGDMLLEKKSGPPPGVLNGVMEPEREYGGSGVGRGEGRLEWQERQIQELLAENERLRERLGDVEREQLEMNRRLAKLEGRGE